MAASGRLHPRDHFWDGKRKPFIIGIIFCFLLLQALFLGNLSYLYGTVFRSAHRAHNIDILNINLDVTGSTIQSSVAAAYSRLRADDFFTLEPRNETKYQSIQAARHAVCSGHYWGALVVNSGAAGRLSSALTGGSAAETYNSSNAITLIYNTAKYTSASLGEVIGSLQTLIGAASGAYGAVDPQAIRDLNTSSPAAVNAFRSPISSTAIDIMPTNQGPRDLYNSVSMVFPIIQQFFFLMALNGLSNTYKLYTSLRIKYAIAMRIFLSTSYTFISSLCMAGYIWAFREDWGVDANQFALTWMVLWLYMIVNFALLDALTGFVPMSFVPFCMITWVVINVASTIYPMALVAGFYHWGMALPAYNCYNLLVEVWTSGCNPLAYRCLPILFSWLVVGTVLANVSMYHRCGVAAKAEAEGEAAIQQRIDGLTGSSAMGGVSDEKPPLSRKDTVELEAGEYDEEIRRKVSNMGVRMPFADTIERLGMPKLVRSATAPDRLA